MHVVALQILEELRKLNGKKSEPPPMVTTFEGNDEHVIREAFAFRKWGIEVAYPALQHYAGNVARPYPAKAVLEAMPPIQGRI